MMFNDSKNFGIPTYCWKKKWACDGETSGIARVGSGQTREGAREVNTSTIYQENV